MTTVVISFNHNTKKKRWKTHCYAEKFAFFHKIALHTTKLQKKKKEMKINHYTKFASFHKIALHTTKLKKKTHCYAKKFASFHNTVISFNHSTLKKKIKIIANREKKIIQGEVNIITFQNQAATAKS